MKLNLLFFPPKFNAQVETVETRKLRDNIKRAWVSIYYDINTLTAVEQEKSCGERRGVAECFFHFSSSKNSILIKSLFLGLLASLGGGGQKISYDLHRGSKKNEKKK